MANIIAIELYNLQWYRTVAFGDEAVGWRDLWAYDQEQTGVEYNLGVGSTHCISLYSDPVGFAPGNRDVGVDWAHATVNDGSGVSDGWTLFYNTGPYPGSTHLKPDTTKSLKIRYKLRAIDATSTVYQPNQWWYQIVNAEVAADHITYAGTNVTGSWAPTIIVTLPGLTNTMVTDSVSLFSWLGEEENWELCWTMPDSTTRFFRPTAAVVTGTTFQTIGGPYDGAAVITSLTFPLLAVGQNGTHTLKLSLLPNDQFTNGWHSFTDDYTWTANITVNMPSQTDALLLSFDTGVSLTINFAT
jgi:hypothetical protein